MHRMMGEETIHTDLQMGQFGIVAVHGGMIRAATLETIRLYTGRKLQKGKSFAYYRVDPPYKVSISIFVMKYPTDFGGLEQLKKTWKKSKIRSRFIQKVRKVVIEGMACQLPSR